MKNILLTGSTGFVGKQLTSYLHNNKYIVQSLNLRRKVVLGEDSDAIIHLAGKAHDLKNASQPQTYFDINTGLTKALFDKFLLSNVRDFIYFSSVKAVADSVEGILLEETFPDPQTAYGQSKQQAEAYLLSQILPTGKRLFILRPCMIHGPGNKGNLNLLYQFVKKGIPYPLAAFENKRSFLSISNLNYIIEKILSDPQIPGGIYNLADDEALSTIRVIQIIALSSGTKSRFWKINPIFIKLAAAVGDKLRLPLNSERLKKLTDSYIVSNKKMNRALNIKSLPITSTEGLSFTIKSFQSV